MVKMKLLYVEQKCSTCKEKVTFMINKNKIKKRTICPNCEVFNYIKMDTIYSNDLVVSGYRGDKIIVKQKF
jgi:DNA-directed RNA polymerase subunit RPC12/RpoP